MLASIYDFALQLVFFFYSMCATTRRPGLSLTDSEHHMIICCAHVPGLTHRGTHAATTADNSDVDHGCQPIASHLYGCLEPLGGPALDRPNDRQGGWP